MAEKSKSRAGIAANVKEKTVGYITAAFGLVAGLAWNEAIKGLIEFLYPLDQNSLWAKFLYATLITLIVVIIGIYLARLSAEKEKEAEKK